METKEILEREAAEKERNETEEQILTLDKWKRGIIRDDKMRVDPVLLLK